MYFIMYTDIFMKFTTILCNRANVYHAQQPFNVLEYSAMFEFGNNSRNWRSMQFSSGFLVNPNMIQIMEVSFLFSEMNYRN